MNGSAKLRQQSTFWCACTYARGEARDKQKPSRYQQPGRYARRREKLDVCTSKPRVARRDKI
eukprot:6074863-Amphidinium_carterae.2